MSSSGNDLQSCVSKKGWDGYSKKIFGHTCSSLIKEFSVKAYDDKLVILFGASGVHFIFTSATSANAIDYEIDGVTLDVHVLK